MIDNQKAGDDLEEAKWIHEQLSRQIDREFDLLGSRMTWMLMVNGGLLTACAINGNNLVGADVNWLVPCFAFAFPILATLETSRAYQSMAAARRVIRSWKQFRIPVEAYLCREHGVRFPLTVGLTRSHDAGNAPYVIAPVVLIVVWTVVLIATAKQLGWSGLIVGVMMVFISFLPIAWCLADEVERQNRDEDDTEELIRQSRTWA